MAYEPSLIRFTLFYRDFIINYRVLDDLGGETYLPLVSDWDLSAAFLSASDPGMKSIVWLQKSNAILN